MKRINHRIAFGFLLAALAGIVGTGCGLRVADLLDTIERRLIGAVDRFQTRDPRAIVLPQSIVDRGDAVVIRNDVEIIISIGEQLAIDELPDITLLGFENLTGFDIYLTYLADGVVQRVFVFEGETLLLEYPCLGVVQLFAEEDYDASGEFVESFDLEADYLNPEDFFCGEALIVTIDPFSVSASIEIIDLFP